MEKLAFDADKLLKTYEPDFAMAYGSGVFTQEGYKEDEKPMIDFIFGVENAGSWHEANLEKNSADYCFMVRALGPKFIRFLHKRGAKMFYNPFIPFDDNTIKYGVISVPDLISDLEHWEHLYAAGRLQKPVKILKSTKAIDKAMLHNKESALKTALLLLPENFTEEELYLTITGYSYMGDPRMAFAENPNKTRCIVGKNIEGFRQLYGRVLNEMEDVVTHLNGGKMQQDVSGYENWRKILHLPRNLLLRLDVKDEAPEKDKIQQDIRRALTTVVRGSSTEQTAVNLFSGGVVKSIRYVGEKMAKARRK